MSNEIPTPEPATQKQSEFVKTQYANLVRKNSSGKLFARIRVGGKLIVKTLKTNSISVGKNRLDELAKRERQRIAHTTAFTTGKMRFADALAIYRTRFQADTELKPRTKEHKEERIAALLRTWTGIEALDISKITKSECVHWAATWQTGGMNKNKTVAVLRNIFELAIEAGVRYDNPAKAIKTAKLRPKILNLPSGEQFKTIIASIRRINKRYSHAAADLAEFLAYGGFRKNEANKIIWGDCDFTPRQENILVRGDAITRTKNWEVRRVDMIPAMIKLLERLKAANPTAKPQDRVMQVGYCLGALRTACESLGIKPLTHHNLRDLFITTCIESGVDYSTIAKWAGHRDGGALIMRTYAHVRPKHTQNKAQQVQFL